MGRNVEAYEYLNKAKKVVDNSPSKNVTLYGQIKLELAIKLFKISLRKGGSG